MQANVGAILLGRESRVTLSTPYDESEERLIERCKKGDERAIGQFIDLYQARVFGFVKRMVATSEEAEDISQEVFIRAFQSINRFDSRANIKTWIFRIAHNLCIDHARKNKRSVQKVSTGVDAEAAEEFEVADESWSPEKLMIQTQMFELVEEAIASMSEKLRAVLLLHDREDLAYDEIAVMLEIPEGTVKSRLFLARNFLQSKLAPYLGVEGGRAS